jgi:hypothetical protein
MPIQDAPVEPFREAFERSGLSQGELARRLGWLNRNKGNSPDSSRVARTLGINGHRSRGVVYYRKHVSEDVAIQLCSALNVLPRDVGL